MELYDSVSYAASRQVTTAYSTSFSKSITLFDKTIQKHIYAIYGLVRIADEIVDTYKGEGQAELLNDLEEETYTALKRGYSTNPIVHAFALTANKYGIDKTLLRPFFVSMAMDLQTINYTQMLYETYIDGSAEVIGLMCLRIFVNGNDAQYKKLEKGARALGAAYQKVNFLRDMSADYKELHRLYFPGVTYETFSETDKQAIVKDIEKDIKLADKSLAALPASSRSAVSLSVAYYGGLLEKIKQTPVDVLKKKRVRVSPVKKTALLITTIAKRKLSHA